MKEIAGAISEGARAFLTAEYKILIVFVAVLFLQIGFGIGSWVTAICFMLGAQSELRSKIHQGHLSIF